MPVRAGDVLSSEFRIFETEQFRKDLKSLARSGQGRIEKKLYEGVYPNLRQRPHLGPHIKKLKGFSPETWRYRIANWRFFYEIDFENRIVAMIAASHRSCAY